MTAHNEKLSVKTRFSPSPTGLIHLGNLRTALFNVLFAKQCQGSFLLRIEDTDRERSSEYYTQCLQQDLLWLNYAWQEGPDHDQGRGPYFQSQRQAIYDEFYHHLERLHLAYPCFCQEEELALARKLQRAAGKPPRYPGTCRHLTAAQINEKLQRQEQPTLRFKVPENTLIEFVDFVRGPQRFRSEDIGDFIIRRADGSPPFLFCNAIDDALMQVTHVIRGEDHLTNTPRQILILQALNLPIANYGHIALIVGTDGSPLSKRHGSRSVAELREQGYLPDAINNYLARLGHYYGHDQFRTLDELAAEFRIENLSKAPAKFNPQQLDYWQKVTVEKLTESDFSNWLGPAVQSIVPKNKWSLFITAIRSNILFPHQALTWAKILFEKINFSADIFKECAVDDLYFSEILKAFAINGADSAAILNQVKDKLSLKGKALFQPLRLALTGLAHGPELDKLFAMIEPEEIKQRLIQADKLSNSHKISD